ncbi:hypothetical protein HAX54_015669, partial [Datura stramonium]|nr:hypothetical protein [Datura stramonium]
PTCHEIGDSEDENNDDLHLTDDVLQHTPFYRENDSFLYDLQDHPEVYASTCESEV